MIPIFLNKYDVDECLKQIKECLESGWTGQGFKTYEFEEEWKKYTGHPYAHMLCTGTAALNLGIQILKEQNGWQEGDEIISTPITFIATNNAVLVNGMKVRFADVDNSLCLDYKDVEQKITERTRAVIYVGLGGNAGHFEEIVELCRKHNLKLILDAAHMAGTRLNGIAPGLLADMTIYSFHTTKNLSTADAGMLCFRDEENDARARSLSWNGIDTKTSPAKYERFYKWKYNISSVQDAYNSNSIMAAIALAQLPHLDHENEYRRQIAQWYDDAFTDVDGIELVEIPDNCISARWIYQILVQDRDALMEFLKEHGIGCALHYLDNTEYPMYSEQYGQCKKAQYVSEHAISLPCHLQLTYNDVMQIANTVKTYIVREKKR